MMPTICDRCGEPMRAWTVSYFNYDRICMNCDKAERAHPDFHRAVAEETAACQRGDYNFPGIGKPDDL